MFCFAGVSMLRFVCLFKFFGTPLFMHGVIRFSHGSEALELCPKTLNPKPCTLHPKPYLKPKT